MISLLELLPEVSEKSGWPWNEQVDSSIYNNNESWPKVTIVTPSYNQGVFIEETIRSILLQNYPNLEFIVIDGGSTDNTVEILNKYSSWITYWISEKDDGQSDAINKGLSKSTGDYFNWINSDDYLEKYALNNLFINHDEKYDIISGYCTIFIDEPRETELTYRLNLRKTPEETIVEHTMCQPSMFYKTSILKKYGGVDKSLHYVMDLALFARYVCEFGYDNIKSIDNVISYFRKHGSSKTESLLDRFEYEEKKFYSFLLSLSKTKKGKIDLISQDNFEPVITWPFKLNANRLKKFIFHKFLLKKAALNYARGNYPVMKKYFKEYIDAKYVTFDLLTLKLFLLTYLVPIRLLRAIKTRSIS